MSEDTSNIAPQLKTLSDEKLIKVVDLFAKELVDRFKQELAGENEDALPRLARTYRSKLVRTAWKASQKWCKWSDDGPVLMPDYTRIYYRRGNTEVTLQEFPPQTRLLKFMGPLVSRRDTGCPLAPGERQEKAYSFSLALPYTVFIFKFIDGIFADGWCAFSDRPLKRLDETPLRPYFTNLNTDLRICHGRGFNQSRLEAGNITQQAAYVLDHFWQSIFSDEWGTHFWDTRRHFSTNDTRLATLQNWQDASVEDPLFVVENVDWLKYSDENFGDMIVKCFEGSDTKFQDEIYEEIVEGLLGEVKKSIEESANKVEEAMSSLDVSEELQKHL